jgi:hypothetical protein
VSGFSPGFCVLTNGRTGFWNAWLTCPSPIDVFVHYEGKRADDIAASRFAVRQLVAQAVSGIEPAMTIAFVPIRLPPSLADASLCRWTSKSLAGGE